MRGPKNLKSMCAPLFLQAYLTVAPFVAQYPEYRRQMAEHLLQAKLQHWDKALRETAAQALAALVPTEPALFEGHFVDALLPLCLHPTLEVTLTHSSSCFWLWSMNTSQIDLQWVQSQPLEHAAACLVDADAPCIVHGHR